MAESVYVSQSGTGTGSSCSNSRAVSWLTSATNWANPKQTGKIGPGDTVFLCGTITSGVSLPGGGASGNPVTIDGTSAVMGTAATVNTSNRSWWVLQNLTWQDGSTGGGGGIVISVSGGANGVIDNVHIYDTSSAFTVFLLQNGSTRPDRITVRNSFFRTAATNFGNSEKDIFRSEGATNIILEGNYFEMRADGASTEPYDDCIQTYQKGGTSGGPNAGWTLRYNEVVMNSNETNDRSWLMIEQWSGTENYIYGNVFLGIKGASQANGVNFHNSVSGMVVNIFNNTFVAKGSASGNTLNLQDTGTANVRNNVFHLQGQSALPGNMATNRSYNLWFGSRIPSCSGITGEICGQDPKFVDYANNNFSLQSTSPARATGTNLGAGPSGATIDYGVAANSTWPNPNEVQRVGGWDRGAFQGAGGGTAPAAPTNFRILTN